ncbi:transposase [Paenibacillus thermoaerophilus]|uniref:Transposase n=1 Tax=Paenibacillus thermoaerophilus TaxID=1215385 RepID=A0ABW2UZD4_9BACL|nr:IS1595 family transposase [Paenibacillus thermoaerophilus]
MFVPAAHVQHIPEAIQSEEACAFALFAAKWPRGYACPRCSCRRCCRIETRRLPLFQCRNCRHQTSLIAGTVFSRSRTPLTKWFQAVFLMSRPDNGISALALHRLIGVTYKTAWLMLAKIRHAMSEADRTVLLSGIVRASAGAYGNVYNPYFDLHPQEHPLMIGASMREPTVPLRIKMIATDRRFSGLKADWATIVRFRQMHVCSSVSDFHCSRSTRGMSDARFLFKIVKTATSWLNRLYHGLGAKHLQKYLDEFTFRYNALLQNELLYPHIERLCASSSAVTYRALVQHAPFPLHNPVRAA